jgi:hypothetical protein
MKVTASPSKVIVRKGGRRGRSGGGWCHEAWLMGNWHWDWKPREWDLAGDAAAWFCQVEASRAKRRALGDPSSPLISIPFILFLLYSCPHVTLPAENKPERGHQFLKGSGKGWRI